MKIYDLRTNIEFGKQIFENIPNEIIPVWAGIVLSRFDHHIKDIPNEIIEIYDIIDNRENWKNAHEQFTKIRRFHLKNQNYRPESYLLLSENVAKVIYNSAE
jgi:hypothetical protein